jgi:hypothetical protein
MPTVDLGRLDEIKLLPGKCGTLKSRKPLILV